MEAMLASLVERYLAQHLHDNATFLAEKLFAQWPSEVNRHLLACCHVYSGRLAEAVAVLKESRVPSNRFLCARYCLRLNRLDEAEEALLRGTGLTDRPIDTFRSAIMADPSKIPNGSAGLYLLGRISRLLGQRDRAVACFKMALQLDPFLFSAFENLSEMGVKVDPEEVFAADLEGGVEAEKAAASMRSSLWGSLAAKGGFESPAPHPRRGGGRSAAMSPPPFTPSPTASFNAGAVSTPPRGGIGATSTPTGAKTGSMAPPRARGRKGVTTPSSRAAAAPLRRSLRLSNTREDGVSRTKAPRAPRTPTSTRSRRGSGSDIDVGGSTSKPLRGVARKRSGSTGSITSGSEGEGEVGGEKSTPIVPRAAPVLGLLRACGSAVNALNQYKCKDALRLLDRLPNQPHDTAWALQRRGIAYFEMADYRKAKASFEAMRRAEPHRTRGLEIFSTTLWHLKSAVDLSFLAQVASNLDQQAPETWCVMGNLYSLQHDHDMARKCLSRAIRLDPYFTYAYTLIGHEHVASGELEKATESYRRAISIDERHYNAYYGLGSILYRQEKAKHAEGHYRRALAINPSSSPLYCHLGMVLHMTGRHEEALKVLGMAARMEPKNPQAHFQRANVFVSLGMYEKALTELETVREQAPREPSVFLAMAKVCKKLSKIDLAVRYFDFARDLDPKEGTSIKRAMDKVHLPDVEDEEEL